MITKSAAEIWLLIAGMTVGTFLIRFSFLGLIGDRELPDWLVRHLRYTPVAVIPGLVVPLVIWPSATDGALDMPRLLAAIMTAAVGYKTKNVLFAIIAGAVTLYSSLALMA